MNPCTKGSQGNKPRSGQALVEVAIVLPLGLLLLLAVGYVGRALLEHQRVLLAARDAARQASLDAMRTPADEFAGLGIVRETMSSGQRDQAAAAAAGAKVQVSAPDWAPVLAIRTPQLHPVPLGDYGMAFVAHSPAQIVDGKTVRFGLGFVLYGAKVSERVSVLDPVRKSLAGVSKTYGTPAKSLLAPLVVSSSAFMPSEAPVHHPAVGLIENNRWIADIVKNSGTSAP